MDRASDSGSEGWGFESLLAYQKGRYPFGYLPFWYFKRDSKRAAERSEVKKCPVDTFLARGRVLSDCRRIRDGCGCNLSLCDDRKSKKECMRKKRPGNPRVNQISQKSADLAWVLLKKHLSNNCNRAIIACVKSKSVGKERRQRLSFF